MKVLILTPQLPYPPHQGTSLRNFHIIRGLAERHEVSLLSFLEPNQSLDPAGISPLISLCQQIETIPIPQRTKAQRLQRLLTNAEPDLAHRLQSQAFQEKLTQMLTTDDYDIVQIEGLELARYMTTVRQTSPNNKILFDDHNAEAELQYRAFQTDLRNPRRWPAAAYSFIQVPRLRRFEAWACHTADWVTVVSDTDNKTLTKLLKKQPKSGNVSPDTSHLAPRTITTIPNSIDTTLYQHPLTPDTPRFDLVFTGKMDYRPNVDAMLWFYDEIWGLVQASRPGTTLAIVGQKPHPRLDRLKGDPHITITGWVDAVQPYLTGAEVIIMPFRVGSGTRLKLIEAMAAGKVIVSTPLGAEGFPVTHGQELWLAQTPTDFANGILHLLNNPIQRTRLTQTAQHFATHYDWRQIIPTFEKAYNQMI